MWAGVFASHAALASIPPTMMHACADDSLSDSEAEVEDGGGGSLSHTPSRGGGGTSAATGVCMSHDDPSWLPAVSDGTAVSGAGAGATCVSPVCGDLNQFLHRYT